MDARDASPPAPHVKGMVGRLALLLEPHGLTVAVERGGTVVVRNPAGAATDPRGMVLYPGLSQRLALREDEGGVWWCWLWPGPERDAPPEVEPMVPVEDVEEAARRITAVLRVDERKGAER